MSANLKPETAYWVQQTDCLFLRTEGARVYYPGFEGFVFFVCNHYSKGEVIVDRFVIVEASSGCLIAPSGYVGARDVEEAEWEAGRILALVTPERLRQIVLKRRAEASDAAAALQQHLRGSCDIPKMPELPDSPTVR